LNYYKEDAKEQENQRKGNVFDMNSPIAPPGINLAGGIIK